MNKHFNFVFEIISLLVKEDVIMTRSVKVKQIITDVIASRRKIQNENVLKGKTGKQKSWVFLRIFF